MSNNQILNTLKAIQHEIALSWLPLWVIGFLFTLGFVQPSPDLSPPLYILFTFALWPIILGATLSP